MEKPCINKVILSYLILSKLEMRAKIKEKSLTPAGFEPTTSGLEHRRSTN